MTRELVVIAARGRRGQLGLDGRMPWRVPEDLQRFKALTMGHPIVMGRRTFESLGRVLPGRPHFVVSRTKRGADPAVTFVASLDEALTQAHARDDVAFVIGGAEIYALALPLATRLEITEVAYDGPADRYFPAIDAERFVLTASQPGTSDGVRFDTYRLRPGAPLRT